MAASEAPIIVLDIDGVIAFEICDGLPQNREILILHKELGAMISEMSHRLYIVTHRSRREAHQILKATRITSSHYCALLAAEDLLLQAYRSRRIGRVLRVGLTKSLALPIIARHSGCRLGDIVLVDDKQHNLDEMRAAGVGLVLKAPSASSADDKSVTTFDMKRVLDAIPEWFEQRHLTPQVWIEAVDRKISHWQRTGMSTHALQDHFFNRGRRWIHRMRRALLEGRTGC